MTTTEGGQPILAGWLSSGSEFSDYLYKLMRRTAHRSTFHGVRVPLHTLRLTVMSPRGLFRVLRTIWRLIFDHESHQLRLDHRDRGETPEYVKLGRMRDERVKNRLIVATVLFVLLLIAGLVAWWLLP